MSLFDIIAIVVTLAALFGYLNHRWLKLEPTVGLLMISLVSSLVVMAMQVIWPQLHIAAGLQTIVANIDFNKALMHGMLGFLLFAGALHVDLEHFIKRKGTIATLATVSLLLSTFFVGGASWLLFNALDLEISFLACLVFGSLISPTDPIAVMGTLKTLQAPKSLEANIAGESLFNDGVAVVVFTGLLALMPGASGHGGDLRFGEMGLFFLREAGGGAALGLATGYITYRLMLSIDAYKVEVMLTLALVMASYSLAWALHVSGPIAVVVAGILIGNRGRALAMSEEVADYLEKFWELIDEMLNTILFVLIGLEVLVVSFSGRRLIAGVAIIGIVLLARLVSVYVPITLIGLRSKFPRGVVRILTWAGLRGGISVALALSMPPSPERTLIVTSTYMVVLFSIVVQGMTIKKVLRKFL